MSKTKKQPSKIVGYDGAIPIVEVRAEGEPYRTYGDERGERSGIHLAFHCPKCGKTNLHGGRYREPGACDGHRLSHCDCWPRGYHLRETQQPNP